MRWINHGLIFRINEHSFGEKLYTFAQSPQVLLFENKIRIYFSTRTLDSGNNFKSTIQFVEYGNNFKDLLYISSHKVISDGGLGAFDEHGIFPMHIKRIDDCIYGYTCGWSRKISVDIEMAIGLAKSIDDGITFERVGVGPILGPTLNEPCMVGDPFVLLSNGEYHMWYIYGSEWKTYPGSARAERIYKIAHAQSPDGIDWKKNKEGTHIIPTTIGDDECQALPSVHFFNGRYNMVFCYRHSSDFRSNSNRGYKIGYAFSFDLENWIRDDEALNLPTSDDGWDSSMQCYPHLFSWKGVVFMLYNGNNFGKDGFGVCELKHP